ncbi:MAG: transporter substrate-binding domain-containing protein [Clostridia bacterium]|nr:transporter substrate-binding domain-containing protein [Clostridia bacterium]
MGGIADNRMSDMAMVWSEQNGLGLEPVLFETQAEQLAAFERGEVDLICQTQSNVSGVVGLSMVAKLGEEPYYLAVSGKRPQLLARLNTALNRMFSIEPFLLQNLQYANYSSAITSKDLTEEEKNWAASHPVMRVGYLNNYLPYSAKGEDGEAAGLMTDVLAGILTALGLDNQVRVEYVPSDNYNDMMAALRQGELDAAFPVYSRPWDLEQLQLAASTPVVTCSESFVFRGQYDKNQLKTIAVNSNNQMQIAYTLRTFPGTELLLLRSIDECLEAVLEGRADGTVLNPLRTELVTAAESTAPCPMCRWARRTAAASA